MRPNTAIRMIDAVAGKPAETTYPATNKIVNDLTPLFTMVNDTLHGDLPWPRFTDVSRPGAGRDFILAAAHLFPDRVFDLARLVTARPPENIHRIQRSNPYWVGDLFSANMIVHALRHCGLERPGARILDIGCSSGSLVRVLAAYDHSWTLFGRDPIDSAIGWARENVVTAQFGAMDTKPPLDFGDAALDGVTAISVWSHHRADAARIWAAEVARILQPGGWFAVTFCGSSHLRWRARLPRVQPKALQEIFSAVAETGNYFKPIDYPGEDSTTDIDWGHSVFSNERFFSLFLDFFEVAGYFPGINQGNQDLAVFIKR